MNDDPTLEPIDSPCRLVCSMEKESGLCYGCGRSAEEIANWPLVSQVARDKILADLPARMPPLEIKLAAQRKLRRVNRRKKSPPTSPSPKDSSPT